MPKPPTFPTLLDNANKLEISFFRVHGYLKPNQYRGIVIRWNINGFEVGSVSAIVYTLSEPAYLELNYRSNETSHNYRIEFFKVPSNLGRGVVWFFLCPRTGKRCRKLYLINGIFCHRQAFAGCLYEKQIQSKGSRQLEKTFGQYFQTEKVFEKLGKKHFKKQYAGKPTKKFLKLTRQLQVAFPLVG